MTPTLNDYDRIWNILDMCPDFHVVLDNDMFWIYPSTKPDTEATDEEYDKWQASGVAIHQPPERVLLEVMIHFLGGDSEYV